jgi:23S rRNA (cytosine1962-C5)-methyltransferase
VDAFLIEALARRTSALPAETTCFRWVDRSPRLPAVTVDVFGPVGVMSFYRPAAPDEVDALARALERLGRLSAIYVKHRPKEAKRAANEQPTEVAPPVPVRGDPIDELIVTEGGLEYVIRPANGLSVGLYLDARDARAWVRAHSSTRRVLNLFAYTCGFGVSARAGGALRAVNVDASRKVLDWGELNLKRNGLTPDRHDFIAGDAFDWLKRLAKRGEAFDLVILDPPGFATTRHSRFTAARDYHQLVAAAAPLIAPRGQLLAMCNVEALSASEFLAHVRRGLGGRAHQVLTHFGASPIDFDPPSALKCVVVEPSGSAP